MDFASQTLGMNLANFALTQSLFLSLRQKGIISIEQANEIVEQSLLNLETHQMSQTAEGFRPAVACARELLELLRQALAADNPR
jgi:hypothetical protein